MSRWQMPEQFPGFKVHTLSGGRVLAQCKRCYYFDSGSVEVRHPKKVLPSPTEAALWMGEHQCGSDSLSAEREMRDYLVKRDARV